MNSFLASFSISPIIRVRVVVDLSAFFRRGGIVEDKESSESLEADVVEIFVRIGGQGMIVEGALLVG